MLIVAIIVISNFSFPNQSDFKSGQDQTLSNKMTKIVIAIIYWVTIHLKTRFDCPYKRKTEKQNE